MCCSCRRKDLRKACEFQAWFSMRCNWRQRTSQSYTYWCGGKTERWLRGTSLLFLLVWALRGGTHGNELAVPPVTNWSREPHTFSLKSYHLLLSSATEADGNKAELGKSRHQASSRRSYSTPHRDLVVQVDTGPHAPPLHQCAECTQIRPYSSGQNTYCPIFKLEVLQDLVFTFQVLSQIRHTYLQKNELSSLSGRKCKGVKRYYLPNLLKRVIWTNWKLTRNDYAQASTDDGNISNARATALKVRTMRVLITVQTWGNLLSNYIQLRE